ncbi:hypothetical protein ACHMWU_07830 [Aeromicrobium sp. UC242_57]
MNPSGRRIEIEGRGCHRVPGVGPTRMIQGQCLTVDGGYYLR